MNQKIFVIISLILLFAAGAAFGQEPAFTALTFQSWKDQQVLEAQNQMLRISARINQLKNGGKAATNDTKEAAELPSRLKKADGDQLALAERDLKRAQDGMESANGLTMEDYIMIYVPTLQDQPEATAKLLEKLSKEDLVIMTKALIRKGRPTEAKHSATASTTGEMLTTAAGRVRLR